MGQLIEEGVPVHDAGELLAGDGRAGIGEDAGDRASRGDEDRGKALPPEAVQGELPGAGRRVAADLDLRDPHQGGKGFLQGLVGEAIAGDEPESAPQAIARFEDGGAITAAGEFKGGHEPCRPAADHCHALLFGPVCEGRSLHEPLPVAFGNEPLQETPADRPAAVGIPAGQFAETTDIGTDGKEGILIKEVVAYLYEGSLCRCRIFGEQRDEHVGPLDILADRAPGLARREELAQGGFYAAGIPVRLLLHCRIDSCSVISLTWRSWNQ